MHQSPQHAAWVPAEPKPAPKDQQPKYNEMFTVCKTCGNGDLSEKKRVLALFFAQVVKTYQGVIARKPGTTREIPRKPKKNPAEPKPPVQPQQARRGPPTRLEIALHPPRKALFRGQASRKVFGIHSFPIHEPEHCDTIPDRTNGEIYAVPFFPYVEG